MRLAAVRMCHKFHWLDVPNSAKSLSDHCAQIVSVCMCVHVKRQQVTLRVSAMFSHPAPHLPLMCLSAKSNPKNIRPSQALPRPSSLSCEMDLATGTAIGCRLHSDRFRVHFLQSSLYTIRHVDPFQDSELLFGRLVSNQGVRNVGSFNFIATQNLAKKAEKLDTPRSRHCYCCCYCCLKRC